MWVRTGDPLSDYEAYEAEQAKKIEKLPVCEDCNEPIQDDELCDFDGSIICMECLKNYIKSTDNYIEWD